jgi:hypothetical protein
MIAAQSRTERQARDAEFPNTGDVDSGPFEFEDRGEIEVKGKGKQRVYLLNRPVAAAMR